MKRNLKPKMTAIFYIDYYSNKVFRQGIDSKSKRQRSRDYSTFGPAGELACLDPQVIEKYLTKKLCTLSKNRLKQQSPVSPITLPVNEVVPEHVVEQEQTPDLFTTESIFGEIDSDFDYSPDFLSESDQFFDIF